MSIVRFAFLVPLTVLVATGVWSPAEACFTEERARILEERHPDLRFTEYAHQMHSHERIEYNFSGPAPCEDGMADIFPCDTVELAGWLDLDQVGGGATTHGTDNWGWQHAASGRAFALLGRSDGVSFVEITDPEAPVYLGELPRPDGVGASTWSDIKTYRDHAFIVADAVSNHGMQVFDLTRLLDVTSPPVSFDVDAHYTEFGCAHNIAINKQTGFAYAVGGSFSCRTCNSGLHMIDINEPTEPEFAGCFGDDGYTHDVQCVIYSGPDKRYSGREICFASNENSVTIVDVTDKSKPEMVGRHTYDGTAYTHQGWLTPDHRYFFFDDELDEIQGLTPDGRTRTLVFDLADLEQAPPPAEYLADGAATDHNQYIVDRYVFQANYRRGFRLLRIDDPATAGLEEVGFFDTYPEGEGTGFQGAWSVYPFFNNGIVLVSDINRGLFIVRITDQGIVNAMQELFHDRFEAQQPQ